jgi:hypothetical protein
MHHLVRFFLEVFFPEFPGCRVYTDLPRNKKEAIHLNGLVIWSYGSWRLAGIDNVHIHVSILKKQNNEFSFIRFLCKK